AHEPTTDFLLTGVNEFSDSLAEWPHLQRIRQLEFTGSGPIVKALLRSPFLSSLRELDGTYVLDAEDVHLIATDDRFAGLTRLNIAWNGLSDPSVEVVARSTVLTQLGTFDFSGNSTTTGALEAIAASPLARRLTFLTCCLEHGSARPFGSHGA